METNRTFKLTVTALFIALVLLFGLTPVGLIPLGFVNVTILCVPVIVGTLLLGFRTGLILGACFADSFLEDRGGSSVFSVLDGRGGWAVSLTGWTPTVTRSSPAALRR